VWTCMCERVSVCVCVCVCVVPISSLPISRARTEVDVLVQMYSSIPAEAARSIMLQLSFTDFTADISEDTPAEACVAS